MFPGQLSNTSDQFVGRRTLVVIVVFANFTFCMFIIIAHVSLDYSTKCIYDMSDICN